jgi:hypothetical protein
MTAAMPISRGASSTPTEAWRPVEGGSRGTRSAARDDEPAPIAGLSSLLLGRSSGGAAFEDELRPVADSEARRASFGPSSANREPGGSSARCAYTEATPLGPGTLRVGWVETEPARPQPALCQGSALSTVRVGCGAGMASLITRTFTRCRALRHKNRLVVLADEIGLKRRPAGRPRTYGNGYAACTAEADRQRTEFRRRACCRCCPLGRGGDRPPRTDHGDASCCRRGCDRSRCRPRRDPNPR